MTKEGKGREDRSSKRQKGKQKASRRDSGRKFKVLLLVLSSTNAVLRLECVCCFIGGSKKLRTAGIRRVVVGRERERERERGASASLSFVLVEITSRIVANAIFEYSRETVFDLRKRTCAVLFSNRFCKSRERSFEDVLIAITFFE